MGTSSKAWLWCGGMGGSQGRWARLGRGLSTGLVPCPSSPRAGTPRGAGSLSHTGALGPQGYGHHLPPALHRARLGFEGTRAQEAKLLLARAPVSHAPLTHTCPCPHALTWVHRLSHACAHSGCTCAGGRVGGAAGAGLGGAWWGGRPGVLACAAWGGTEGFLEAPRCCPQPCLLALREGQVCAPAGAPAGGKAGVGGRAWGRGAALTPAPPLPQHPQWLPLCHPHLQRLRQPGPLRLVPFLLRHQGAPAAL